MQKFSGRGTPPPHTPSPRCLWRLDLRAYGAQAQRDNPEKNPSYGLGQTGKALDTAYKR